MQEELRNSDYGNYTPKCIPIHSKGFMYYEIQRIEHNNNNYSITFKNGLLVPGVIMPDNLGFKPETDMKVIWDSTAELGAEGYLSFYDKQGKQLCALHRERASNVWHNITGKDKGVFELQRMIEFDQPAETLQPINSKVKDAMVERLKDLGAQVVSNTEYPLSGHAFEKEDAEIKEAVKPQTGFNKIKSEYKSIRDAEEFMEKRISTIMSNTAYVDYEMIRKEQEKTRSGIARIKESIEEKYGEINPELAALRKEEKNKIEAGMEPKQAQKERREAVKAYYNKKSPREC